MADSTWKHDIIRFLNKGLDVVNPLEDVPDGYYSRFTNAQSLQEGSIVARPGLTKINSSAISGTPEVHSMMRLENPAGGNTIRVVGAGTVVWTGETSFTSRSTSWSGQPLTMVAWRTFLDDQTWVYIGDRSKTERINQAGTAVQVGISKPQRSGANDEYGHLRTPVINDGTALVIYDLASTGAAPTDWVVNGYTPPIGEKRDRDPTLDGSDNPPVAVGASGTVQVKKPTRKGVATSVNAVSAYTVSAGEQKLYFGHLAESGEALWNGTTSSLDLRTKTAGSTLLEVFLGSSNIDHVDDLLIKFSLAPVKAVGADYTDSGVASSARNATGGSDNMIRVLVTGHGYTTNDLVLIQDADASTKANGVWEIIWVNANSFDLKGSRWTATHANRGTSLNFSSNYFVGFGRDNVLAKAKEGRESLRESIRREVEDEYFDDQYGGMEDDFYTDTGGDYYSHYISPEEWGVEEAIRMKEQYVFGTGANQHFAFSLARNKFSRVGSDRTRDWRHVTGIVFEWGLNGEATVNEQFAFAKFDMVPPAGALNSSNGIKYDWRYTYYDSATGSESLPSPVAPEGLDVVNQTVTLTLDGAVTTTADRIRIYRRGGAHTDWKLVDTVPNPGDGSTRTYIDIKDDISIGSSPSLNRPGGPTESYRPVPVPVQVTNHLQFSQRFNDGGVWTLSNATISPNVEQAPDASMGADELITTSSDGYIKQTLSISTVTHYWSLYVKRSEGTGTVSLFYKPSSGSDVLRTIALATPAASDTGIWERFIFDVPAGALAVGIKLATSGDSVYIWGAQLETWDSAIGLLPPASYIGTEHLIPGQDVYSGPPGARPKSRKPRRPFIQTPESRIKHGPIEQTPTYHPDKFESQQAYLGLHSDATTAVSMEVLDAAPPQIIFGPYDGRYLLAIRPHKSATEVIYGNYIFWSSPYNGDVWPAQNYLEVAPNGEPLQNGFIYRGSPYVFSMESLYKITAPPVGPATFISMKTECGVGLWARYALAVGPQIWWLGKDGIYTSRGGQEVSITENSPIRPLFKGQTVNGYLPVNLDADDDELRLVWRDPHLYFSYKDTGGAFKCLRYHTPGSLGEGRWEFFDYSPNIRMGIWEQEQRNLLLGDDAGFIYAESGTADHTTAIDPVIRTGSLDQGEPGALKLYGDVHVEATIPSGVNVAVKPYFDDEGSTVTATNLAGTAARKRYKINLGNSRVQRAVALDFSWTTNSTSPILHEADISYKVHADEGTTIWDSDYENDGNLEDKWVHGLYLECDTAGANHVVRVDIDGTEITGSPFTVNVNGRQMHKISFEPVRGVSLRFYSDTAAQNPGILYDYKWLYSQEPAHLQEPFTWGDLGWPYEKYVKGFAITADTFNQAVTLQVRTNGDESTNPLASSETFTIQHNGPSTSQIRLSHGSTYRLLAETIRLTNTSANPLRIYDLHWDFDREPASLLAHRTQESTFGGTDWAHIRDGYIALRSSAAVTLTINVDGTDLTAITLASTSSLRKKLHFFPVAHKGKVFTFTLTSSAAFKLYLEDCHIWVKPWNQQVGYTKYQIPFEGPRSPTRRLVESLGSLSGGQQQSTQRGAA